MSMFFGSMVSARSHVPRHLPAHDILVSRFAFPACSQ